MEKPAPYDIEAERHATETDDAPKVDTAPDHLAEATTLVENLPKQAKRDDLNKIVEHLSRVDDEISVGMVIKSITDHAAFKGLGRDIKKEVKRLREKYHAAAEAHAHAAAQAEAAKEAADKAKTGTAERGTEKEGAEKTDAETKVDYSPLNYFKDKGYAVAQVGDKVVIMQPPRVVGYRCLLYTSDAADE